ncbi:MAG: peptidylprolyl isomerase [Geminicoccaceae bacterium]|nr:peptidylprolyl isomerase [Geminicoccaceae bacterium]
MDLRLGLRLALFLLAVVIPPSVGAPAYGQGAQRIAAVVNNDIISLQDLAERVDLAIVFSGINADPAARRRLTPQVLRRLIDERLQMQEATRLSLVASDPEINSAIARLAEPNGMTSGQLLDNLSRSGVNPEHLREQVRAELSWVRLIRRRIAPRATVSDRQVDLALDAEKDGGEQEMQLSEIVLPVYDPSRLDEALAAGRELMAAVRDGADFAALARQVSVGETAEAGGDLGWVPISDVPGGLRPAVAALQPGQLSDPLPSPTGVHLFLVRDRRDGQSVASDPDARKLAQIFFPLAPQAPAESVELANAQAVALGPRLQNCDAVIDVADQLDTPGSGDLGWVHPRDIPADLARIIAQLPVGKISEPIRSASGIHLIMVCATGGDQAEELRRDQMRAKLERAQIQRLANRYLRDLRKDAFIDVRVNF